MFLRVNDYFTKSRISMSKLLYRLLTLTLLLGLLNSLSAQTQTLRFKPLTSSDDAEQNTATGAVYLNSTDLELGGYDYDFVYKQVVGIRFPNVTIPQGAIITKAYIQFSVDELRAGVPTSTTINIKAQKGNAATYSTAANDISSRNYTSNMAWNPPAWTVVDQRLAAQQTPDIKALVIEAMQSGFSSGNALGFCLSTVNNALFTAYSIDRSAVHAPELVIEYAPLSISADKPSGTYYNAFFLNLTGSAGATIRYTADGSTPTATSGVVYTAPIAVKVSSTIKAVSVFNGNVSPVLTLNYTFSAPPEACTSPRNLALNKTTSQSSTYAYGGESRRAVDNNTSGNWGDNSITHTDYTVQPWWQVDLGSVNNIDVVKIFNRTDCCSERLSDFYVLASETPFTSNDLNTTLSQSGIKSYFYTGIAPANVNIPLNVKGRYIRIQLKGQNVLSLAEVQVEGCESNNLPTCSTLSNLALKKQTSQSITAYGGDGARAVDGNTSGNWSDNSVTHTEATPQAWWQVDLGAVHSIDFVKLYNRTDCCSERLSDFYVLVSSVPFSSTDLATTLAQTTTKSYYYAGIAPAQMDVPFNVLGRYVRIQLKSQNYLSLAEVQVMGCKTAECMGTNIALGKKSTQSSTAFGGESNRATDNNTSNSWAGNSMTHTNFDLQAWWQLDLEGSYNIDSIRLFNRMDCCSERLSDFYVIVSDNPFSSTDLNTTLAQSGVKSYYYAGIAPAQLSIPFLTIGRYVRVQLKGQNALSLAEVQVMGCEIYTPLPRTKLSNIFINEVSSTGTTEIKNDWIEIYNNNDFEVSLDSVFITDTKGDLRPFMFRNKNLPAKGYTVVEANDTVTSPISTIASMAISAKGETVYLYQQYQGVLYTLDTLAVPALGSNETYGRVKDGTSTLIKMVNPSPRKSNNNGLILLDMVIASRPRGIYEAPFTLTLTAPAGATIRYTLDGTAPTATTGLVYTAPLSINASTAIRAIATTATGQSKIMTQTYVFPSSVASKLSMAASDVSTALKTLPIAVINTPGDFNNITNQFSCSFEYINKFGENKSVQSDAGYGAFGNYSLYTAAKKSYRVSFSSKYGVGNLKYKVFDKTADENYNPAEEFDALDLKAGHDMTGTDISGMMMSDYLVRTLMHKLGSKDVHSRFVHLFFNGQYHGVYALREHFSPDYVEPYYSGDKDNMEYASAENEPDWRWGNSPVQQQGSGELWNSIRTDSNNKNFQALKSKVDLPHLMNMMMVYLLGGAEPEYKSVIGYRYDPKLILFHKDVDAYMNGFGRGATVYKTNLTNCAQGPGNLLAMTGISGGTVNREYQTMMKDAIRLAMLQSNSVLTSTGISTVINQASAILTPNMAIDNARWGNISPASFASNVQIMKNDLPKKISDVIAYYRTYNLIHTLEPVTYSKAAGAAAVGEKIFITNPNPNTIVYYTTDGTDVVLDNAVSPTAKLYNASTGIVLPIGKTRIRARAYNRVDNFGMYADIEYIVQSPIKITAICYQPNPAAPAAEPKGSDAYEFFNLTNTTTSAVDISNFLITEAIDTFRFPQGTSIAAGETIMMCSDETKYPLVTLRKFKWSKGKLANEGENISFKNAIGTVYNEVKYDTLSPWPYAKGNGLYIRLKSNDLDNSKGANWQASSLNSLLTTGVMALSNNLVFSAEGRQEGAKAIINWVANTSKNIDYFVVEKLDANKQIFEPFETVNVKPLTSSTGAQYYSIIDNTPKNDVVTYRVALVLNDKTPPQYSAAIRLDFSHLSAYTMYPNPAQDFIDIDLGQNTIEQGTIRIMNLVGTTVLERSIEHAKANIRLDLNSIKEGQYIIFLDIKGKKSISKKLTITK